MTHRYLSVTPPLNMGRVANVTRKHPNALIRRTWAGELMARWRKRTSARGWEAEVGDAGMQRDSQGEFCHYLLDNYTPSRVSSQIRHESERGVSWQT